MSCHSCLYSSLSSVAKRPRGCVVDRKSVRKKTIRRYLVRLWGRILYLAHCSTAPCTPLCRHLKRRECHRQVCSLLGRGKLSSNSCKEGQLGCLSLWRSIGLDGGGGVSGYMFLEGKSGWLKVRESFLNLFYLVVWSG